MFLRPYLDGKPLGVLSNMKLTKQQQKGACVHLGSKYFFAILHTWFACTSFITTE